MSKLNCLYIQKRRQAKEPLYIGMHTLQISMRQQDKKHPQTPERRWIQLKPGANWHEYYLCALKIYTQQERQALQAHVHERSSSKVSKRLILVLGFLKNYAFLKPCQSPNDPWPLRVVNPNSMYRKDLSVTFLPNFVNKFWKSANKSENSTFFT